MIEIKEEFKHRLDTALAFANMKPIDLASKTGISEATISQYRSGYSKPKDKRLVQIANALNVNPSWLMGLDVPMQISETPAAPSDSDRARRLYENYLKVPPEVQATIDLLLGYPQSKSEHQAEEN